MSLAKVAGITVVVGGGAAATTFILTNGSDIPNWSSLSSESNFSQDYSSGKFGNVYGKFLVSTLNADNEYWWKWSFKNRYSKEETKNQTDFQNLESESALKSSCKKAFEADEGKIKSTDNPSTGEYSEKIIWKLCSPLGNKPITVSEKNDEKSEYTTGNLGNDETENKKLVSISASENTIFWDIKQQLFFSDVGKPSETDKFFDAFYQKEKNNTNKALLKDECKKAYKLPKPTSTTSTETQPTVSEVLKYCSLKGS